MAHALIIEDNFLVAASIEETLRQLGYTSFAFAMTEDEAVAAAEGQCPKLITSDVRLEPGSGIDAVQRICANGRAIPVVYITGSAEEVRERCATAVIVGKPFGILDLRAAITTASAATPPSANR